MFAPCDKVIISQEDNSPSLISILENIHINIPVNVAVINLPYRWQLFTLWKRQPEDEGKIYQQRTHLTLPDGQPTVESTLDFRVVTSTQRIVVNIFGFPVLPSGEYPLKLSLREAGQVDGWKDVAEYPLMVTRMS
jgi:hypothetical protein